MLYLSANDQFEYLILKNSFIKNNLYIYKI